jgi:hypothetical protein
LAVVKVRGGGRPGRAGPRAGGGWRRKKERWKKRKKKKMVWYILGIYPFTV